MISASVISPDCRLVEALRSGVAPDFDVYDAATWSSIAVLDEKSVNPSQIQSL